MKQKIYGILAIIFCLLTAIGAVYFFADWRGHSAWMAGVGGAFLVLFAALYQREKNRS